MTTWRDNARCKTVGFAVFDNDDDTTLDRKAKGVCGSCTVQASCLDDALALERGLPIDHRTGILGGLNPRERYNLDRARRRQDERQAARARQLQDLELAQAA